MGRGHHSQPPGTYGPWTQQQTHSFWEMRGFWSATLKGPWESHPQMDWNPTSAVPGSSCVLLNCIEKWGPGSRSVAALFREQLAPSGLPQGIVGTWACCLLTCVQVPCLRRCWRSAVALCARLAVPQTPENEVVNQRRRLGEFFLEKGVPEHRNCLIVLWPPIRGGSVDSE